jgi:hypothetical protein
MQDIYALDVGDFGKLGLLRRLTTSTDLSLGVLWWKTSVGSAAADGKHVSYLRKEHYSHPDPQLWLNMRERFRLGSRRIRTLETLLPNGTVFHRRPVPMNEHRRRWFGDAAELVKRADIVFCDPDNGIKLGDVCYSVRHIGLQEIRALWEQGHSIVIYHHLNRSALHRTQITRLLAHFQSELPGLTLSFGAWFRRGSSRVFIVLGQRRHASAIGQALRALESSPWVSHHHFVIVRPNHDHKSPQVLRVAASDLGGPGGLSRGRPKSPLSDLTSAHHQDSAGRRLVSVLLNDNGGLNAAANPWLIGAIMPLNVTSVTNVTFRVEGTFAARRDMFRVRPSALTIAKSLGFKGAHLSKQKPVMFMATLT